MADADPLICRTQKRSTTVELPAALREAVEARIGQLQDLGERVFLTDIVQTGLFHAVQNDPESLAEAFREYRRAHLSGLPPSTRKVIPLPRAGRPPGKAVS